MSYPYHHFYALNNQRGHQLFYDQVLEKYPIQYQGALANSGPYTAGGYQADGTVISWGQDCTVATTDQYGMPGCCSTWADGRATSNCCACGSLPMVDATTQIPAPFFPVTMETEMNAAVNHN